MSAESEAYLFNERGEAQANITDFTDAGKRWTSSASSVTHSTQFGRVRSTQSSTIFQVRH